jgi:hypothetical protein
MGSNPIHLTYFFAASKEPSGQPKTLSPTMAHSTTLQDEHGRLMQQILFNLARFGALCEDERDAQSDELFRTNGPLEERIQEIQQELQQEYDPLSLLFTNCFLRLARDHARPDFARELREDHGGPCTSGQSQNVVNTE